MCTLRDNYCCPVCVSSTDSSDALVQCLCLAFMWGAAAQSLGAPDS